MACYWIKLPDGTVAHVNMGRQRTQWCWICEMNGRGKVAATRLCDHPLGNGKTCDKPTCDRHHRSVGKDVDYCVTHGPGLFE